MIKKSIARVILMCLVIAVIVTIVFYMFDYFMYKNWVESIEFRDFIDIGTAHYKRFFQDAIVDGNWGYTAEGDLVVDVIFAKFWMSLKWVLVSIIIFIPTGIGLGILTAVYNGSLFDKIISKFILIVGSMPTFLIMTFFIVVLGYGLDLLPQGWVLVRLGFYSEFEGLIMPVFTLCLYPIAIISNTLRSEIIDSFTSEHYQLCRAKGLTRRQSIIKHSLREGLIPLIPVIGNMIVFVIGGSFVVEIIYNIPGVAELLYDSLIKTNPDLEMVFLSVDLYVTWLITLYYMVLIMVLLMITDVFSYLIDPRIKYNRFMS